MSDTPSDGEPIYQEIFESAGAAILVLDREGGILESNACAAPLLGYSAAQLHGMTLRKLTHEEDARRCTEMFAELMSERLQRYQLDTRYVRSDGMVIWTVLTVSRMPHAPHSTAFAIALIENITDRKHAEEALYSSFEQLQAGVRATNTGIWDWNLQTNEVYFSPEWKQQLGYIGDEILPRLEEFFGRLHPEDRSPITVALLAFLRAPGPSFHCEFRLRHADGSYRWIMSRATLLRSSDGAPRRLLGAHLDITERKRTEMRLREYESVVETLQEPIVVIDRDYRYLIANRAFLHYCGLPRSQVLGSEMAESLGHDAFHAIAKPKLEKCFEGRRVEYEMQFTHAMLGERQMRVSCFPLDGFHGADRVACVLEDITDRNLAEQELRQTYQRLTVELNERTRAEQSVRALSDRLITAQEEERRLIARELHDDLSQEIAALSITVSNLKQSIPEENIALRGQTDAVHQRISHLAGRVRHLSRKLHPAVLEYSGIAAALRSFSTEFSAVSGISVMVEAEGSFDDVPAPIGLCLYRVTQEALQNVVKHSKARHANVRIERHPDTVSLMIRDTGQGFEEAQSNAERGLGLVSMSERVRLAHGAIEIQSLPGEGTTINVSIPC
jgi:PAS domain S-box-containing protein